MSPRSRIATARRRHSCRQPFAGAGTIGGGFPRGSGSTRFFRGWYSRSHAFDSPLKMETSLMKILRLAMLAAGLLLSLQAGVHAQTTLRIGLAEDPDVLDPTMARPYVGRIVFASFCDKLFDIDEKLNIVPQLALSHQTSSDGNEMTIKLRSGFKFHDGEPFDAEAAKFSLQ